MNALLKIALRQRAILVPKTMQVATHQQLSQSTVLLIVNLGKLGFSVTESLLHALNAVEPTIHLEILNHFQEVMGVNKNWTPLVKGWDTPTGATYADHLVTFFYNVFKIHRADGTRLACGHAIPPSTFPLERYNGCPFCGTPFETNILELHQQGSPKKILDLWTEPEIEQFFKDLLTSKTALDATQMDSLKILLTHLPLPVVEVSMKETLMAVIDILLAADQSDKAQALFKTPTDILRYLWYKKTGFLQIIEPKMIIKRHNKNNRHIAIFRNQFAQAKWAKIDALKLKYGRKESIIVARWLNGLMDTPEKCCEIMHPKREIWVRYIRALRLVEYAQRPGFEKLAALLQAFHGESYPVWQGRVHFFRLRKDAYKTFSLLQQRPGLFARSLFANILWFGVDETIAAFSVVIDKVPARLVFTLNMYAEHYFNPVMGRTVQPLGGVAKWIPVNRHLHGLNAKELHQIKEKVESLTFLAMQKRFARLENRNQTMYINPALFNMPISIGDRSETIQDMSAALQGTRFPVEGDIVRLFMQWGNGLGEQHLDMDLSCHIAFHDNEMDYCSYSRLKATGAQHSGDIQYIPNLVGTAEYIDLNINILQSKKVKYVTFTCNAYTRGSLSPNLVVGWMSAQYPMHISKKTGVAYDPSCVQHQVRITQTLSKGLVFGVLDVDTREIIWLEVPFEGQVVHYLDVKNVNNMLGKLNSKLSIGNLLKIKALSQNLTLIETPNADEVYDMQWAMNAAAVTQLLID
jgi:hypothetical protein